MQNNQYKYYPFLLILLVVFLQSCQKEIHVKLPPYTPETVVEGWIEQDQPAMVIVSKNAVYFGTTDSASLANMIVTNAIVKITDGIQTDSLKLQLDLRYFPPFVYVGTMKGVIGKTYYLTVKTNGQTVTSFTTIPSPVALDSLWFSPDTPGDSLGLLSAKFTDPPHVKNYYRLFTLRLHKDKKFVPILGSVYDDAFFDGKTFTFSMRRGNDNLANNNQNQSPQDRKENGHFNINDTVVVKVSSIDEATYNFWKTIEQQEFTGGNPFGQPIPIQSNINPGLGVWGGYGSSYDTLFPKIMKK